MATDPGKTIVLPLDKIRTDGDTQPRCALTDPAVVNDYHEMILDGAEFPPGVVFFDGKDYWLAEGFQRRSALLLAGRSHMVCRVLPGGVHEARLHAAGSNATHGLRRSAADQRRAVYMVLADPEGKTWAVDRIARHCQVPRGLVRALQASTPWPSKPNLFGEPDDLHPPEPDYALEDRAALEERMLRACRKYLRFCERFGADFVEVARRVAEEMERARPKKPEPAAEPAGPEMITLDGACA